MNGARIQICQIFIELFGIPQKHSILVVILLCLLTSNIDDHYWILFIRLSEFQNNNVCTKWCYPSQEKIERYFEMIIKCLRTEMLIFTIVHTFPQMKCIVLEDISIWNEVISGNSANLILLVFFSSYENCIHTMYKYQV